MENVKEFLESSSIIGLSLIANSRRFVLKLFWILVVIGGFAWAFYMIFECFEDWKQKPISTTIETLPIEKIIFPNVTVCPPRNLFLNLNHDIKESEKIRLTDETRDELLDYSLDVIQDTFYKEVMANLSKLEDPDRFYNWYHRFTSIKYPYYKTYENYKQLNYFVRTSATSGNISTQYFGDKFDASKVEKDNIMIEIYVYVPKSIWGDKSSAMLVNIQKTEECLQ